MCVYRKGLLCWLAPVWLFFLALFFFFLLRLPERVTVLVGSCQHLLGLVHLVCVVVCVCVREREFKLLFYIISSNYHFRFLGVCPIYVQRPGTRWWCRWCGGGGAVLIHIYSPPPPFLPPFRV